MCKTKLGARVTEKRNSVSPLKYYGRGTHYKDTQQWNINYEKSSLTSVKAFIIPKFILEWSFELAEQKTFQVQRHETAHRLREVV